MREKLIEIIKMCGLAGIYNFNGQLVERDELKAMNQKMLHRGPDDEGFFISSSFGMAMRRLSIIDLKGGKQPVANEDGRFQVILNGEIYNYLELKKELENKGHIFKTQSDTEVLVHLFEEEGPRLVHKLNGMFAFAIWDDERKELFIFRDRIGVKPLFYGTQKNRFAFSSDLGALSTIFKKREIDLDSFLFYLGLSYVPYPHTILKNVFKLPPGHFIHIRKNNQVEISKYWDIQEFETLKFNKIEDYEEMILALLKDSIRLHLRSDVPVGTFLSGGLDSSSVVGLLSAFIEEPVRTFSVGFENGLNELPLARLVAQRFKTSHLEATIKGEDVHGIIQESILFMDEPLSDNAFIPTLMLSKLAREKGVKVILNGTGGDELFGGYERYINKRLSWRLLGKMPRTLQKFFAELTSYLDRARSMRISEPALNFIVAISGINLPLALKILKSRKDKQKLTSNLLNLYNQYVAPEYSNSRQLSRLMYFDFKSYLVDDILSLLDKMTMAASIEGRVPLLDWRIVEAAFKIPDKIKFHQGCLKGFLKETLKPILPAELFSLPKAGLAGPTSWWVNILKEPIYQSIIQDPNPLYQEFFDLKAIKRILENNEIKHSYAETLFSLYIFNLWYCQQISKH